MVELLDEALDKEYETKLTEEELMSSLDQTKNPLITDPEISLSPMVPVTVTAAPTSTMDKAYNVIYDKATDRYMLVTVEYDSTKVTPEYFAKGLPETNFKVSKLFIDKLVKLMYGK